MRSVSSAMRTERGGQADDAPAWFVLPADAQVRAATLGFLRLAVMALLWSGVFVLVVALGRTPLVAMFAGRDYLYTALVAHVVFALDVWLLSFGAGLWVIGAARHGRPLPALATRVALALAWTGSLLLVVIPLLGLGQPVMADYVPVLLHPHFLVGLGAFFAGIAIVAVALLRVWRSLVGSLEGRALVLGAAGYLAALVAFGLAGLRWGTGDLATIAWGGGHLFQLVNATSLIAIWLMMVPRLGWRARSLIGGSFIGFVIAPALVLFSYIPPFSWGTIGLSFWSGLGVPLSVTWLVLAADLLRRWRQERRWPRVGPFLPFTLVLFALGGLITLPGLGYDTRVTAHYHATVGAVTMAFMALAYALAPQLGRVVAWPRLARLQPHLYGFGLLLLVGGLYWAGEAGTARKIFEAIATDRSLLPAATLFGLGALATIVGGVAFVLGLGRTLIGRVPRPAARLDSPVIETSQPAPVRPGSAGD